MNADLGVPYSFKASVWKYDGEAAWHFVSLTKPISDEIREHFKSLEEGWGRLKVKAQIGNTLWDTAIWFDTKADTYILPLKAEIRKKEKISEGDLVKVKVMI